MQDGESEMDYLVHWRRKELVYPTYLEYKVETGGRLKNLRTTCSNDKVRAFHKQFYNLHNMVVIVSGKIDHNELLGVVERFEDEVLKQTPPKFERPFTKPVPPIEKKISSKVLCPSDDTSQGTVQISWLGPSAAVSLFETCTG
jgi:Zn-dependent M16 (insulinase) family peptidase